MDTEPEYIDATTVAKWLVLASPARALVLADIGAIPRPVNVDRARPMWKASEVCAFALAVEAERRGAMREDGLLARLQNIDAGDDECDSNSN